MEVKSTLFSSLIAIAISCAVLLGCCGSVLAETGSNFAITYEKGTDGCYSESVIDGERVITFSGMTEDTTYSITGTLNGSIVIDASDDYKFTLELNGVTITSYNNAPIVFTGGDKAVLSAQKGTTNYVYDYRNAVGDDSDYSSSIYSKCDLDISGKGSLYVYSENNNGIQTKDDLDVKNLTLLVQCMDNALKGNDSVTIESGTLTLIATEGDGIKTSNSDVSSKGNQRGTVTVCSDKGKTELTIYSAFDGIDAAYDVVISESETNAVNIDIYTSKYSSYTSADVVKETCTYDSTTRDSSGWAVLEEKNQDKCINSAKGIKADNTITISGGNINVKAYDDAIHANSGSELENGSTSLGNVTITGGVMSLYASDDAVHADGVLTITGGEIGITYCFEGLEGNTIAISGGSISIVSIDDGINAVSTIGTAITISGGYIYIFAGDDGIDSNSKEYNVGFVITGGVVVVISTGIASCSLDSERGYTVSGGMVLAVCSVNAMLQDVNGTRSAKSIAWLDSPSYVKVTVSGETVVVVEMPVEMRAYAVFLGTDSAKITAESSNSLGLDSNGVYAKSIESGSSGHDSGTSGSSESSGSGSSSSGTSGGTSSGSGSSSGGTSPDGASSSRTSDAESSSDGSFSMIALLAGAAIAAIAGVLAVVFKRH